MKLEKYEFGIFAIVLLVVLFGEWFADLIARKPILIVVIAAIAFALAHYIQRRKSRR